MSEGVEQANEAREQSKMRNKIWVGVGMVVVAGTASSAQPIAADAAGKVGAQSSFQVAAADTAKALPAGQGGEGGEAGAAANLDAKSDAAYAASLAELRAHVALGDELVLRGHGQDAKARLEHALEEIYPRVVAAFEARKVSPFDADLKAAIAAATGPKDGFGPVQAALMKKIAAAEPAAPGGHTPLPQTVAVLVGLLKAASVEYGEALDGKTVKSMPEYQYTYAFMRAAADALSEARPALAAKDVAALKAVSEGVATLRAAVPGLFPEQHTLIASDAFTALVSRIELKASRFTN